MRLPSLSPTAYRRITFVAAVLLAVIIVTGGAVRLTSSGLGCPSWPHCSTSELVKHSASSIHKTIEETNRRFTGAVCVAVIVAVLGALRRVPRRRDLTWLAAGLVVGVLAQAVLGGLTVLFDLAPQFVMAHFLLSIVLLTNAIVLHRRAGQPDGAARPLVNAGAIRAGRVLLVLAGAVLFTGTIVTGSGPHSGGGAHDDVKRLDLAIPEVARVHGVAVMTFLAAVLVTLWLLTRAGAPRIVLRRVSVLFVVLVAQAGVGYTQYFTGIPPLLVGIHIAGRRRCGRRRSRCTWGSSSGFPTRRRRYRPWRLATRPWLPRWREPPGVSEPVPCAWLVEPAAGAPRSRRVRCGA